MGFWKELGVASIEKGKSIFRSGKQSLEAAKNAESLVKGAKVTQVAVEKSKMVEQGAKVAKVSKPASGHSANYLAWEKSLPKPSFSPSFNGRWDRFKYAVKDSWNGLWNSSSKVPKPEMPKPSATPSLYELMKNWFSRGTHSNVAKGATEEISSSVKSATKPLSKKSGYLAWERSLPEPSFTPSFNSRWDRFKYSVKDKWNSYWVRGEKTQTIEAVKTSSSPTVFERVKNWFGKNFHSKEAKPVTIESASSVKPTRNPIFKDSGYMAWEKSLPKPSFTPKFNAVSKQKEAAKASKEVVQEASKAEKTAEQVGEKAAKAAEQNAKNTKKAEEIISEGAETSETAQKATEEAVKQESTLKKAARFYAKNPKVMGWHALMGIGTYGVLSGEGVIKPMLYCFGGKNAAENGLGGVVGQAVAGDKAPDIYDKVTNAAGAVVDEGVNLYQTGKYALGGVAGEGVSLYNMGKDYVGNGMVNNGSGGYYDPTTPAYPNPYQASDSSINPQEGMLGGMMNGMNEAVNQVSGGNVSKMNILTLALSAYMMFGRFGWLGKAASLLLGGMTLKNINNRQMVPTQTQQQMPQLQQVPPQVPAVQSQPPMYKALDNETTADDDIVYRSRGMRM